MDSSRLASMPEYNEPNVGSPSASDTESADMAAMMGFSSFGPKPNPPSKKRKLGQPAASGFGAESGSGSNSMPLGKPRGQKKETEGGPRGLDEQDREWREGHVDSVEAERVVKAITEEKIDGGVKDTANRGQLSTGKTDNQAGLPAGGWQNQYDWHALRKGIKDESGDVAYYDASFVEDPWKHLTT